MSANVLNHRSDCADISATTSSTIPANSVISENSAFTSLTPLEEGSKTSVSSTKVAIVKQGSVQCLQANAEGMKNPISNELLSPNFNKKCFNQPALENTSTKTKRVKKKRTKKLTSEVIEKILSSVHKETDQSELIQSYLCNEVQGHEEKKNKRKDSNPAKTDKSSKIHEHNNNSQENSKKPSYDNAFINKNDVNMPRSPTDTHHNLQHVENYTSVSSKAVTNDINVTSEHRNILKQAADGADIQSECENTGKAESFATCKGKDVDTLASKSDHIENVVKNTIHTGNIVTETIPSKLTTELEENTYNNMEIDSEAVNAFLAYDFDDDPESNLDQPMDTDPDDIWNVAMMATSLLPLIPSKSKTKVKNSSFDSIKDSTSKKDTEQVTNVSPIPDDVLSVVGSKKCSFIFHSIAQRLQNIKTNRSLPRIEGKILKSTMKKITPMYETSTMKGELSSTDEESRVGVFTRSTSHTHSTNGSMYDPKLSEAMAFATFEDPGLDVDAVKMKSEKKSKKKEKKERKRLMKIKKKNRTGDMHGKVKSHLPTSSNDEVTAVNLVAIESKSEKGELTGQRKECAVENKEDRNDYLAWKEKQRLTLYGKSTSNSTKSEHDDRHGNSNRHCEKTRDKYREKSRDRHRDKSRERQRDISSERHYERSSEGHHERTSEKHRERSREKHRKRRQTSEDRKISTDTRNVTSRSRSRERDRSLSSEISDIMARVLVKKSIRGSRDSAVSSDKFVLVLNDEENMLNGKADTTQNKDTRGVQEENIKSSTCGDEHIEQNACKLPANPATVLSIVESETLDNKVSKHVKQNKSKLTVDEFEEEKNNKPFTDSEISSLTSVSDLEKMNFATNCNQLHSVKEMDWNGVNTTDSIHVRIPFAEMVGCVLSNSQVHNETISLDKDGASSLRVKGAKEDASRLSVMGVKNDASSIPLKVVKKYTSSKPIKSVKEYTSSIPVKSVKEDTPSILVKSVKEDASSIPVKSVKEDASSIPVKSVKEDTPSILVKSVKEDASSIPVKSVKEDTPSIPVKSVKEDMSSIPVKSVKEDTPSILVKGVKEDTPSKPIKSVKEYTSSIPVKSVKEDTPSKPVKSVKEDTSSIPVKVVKEYTSSIPVNDVKRDALSIPVKSVKYDALSLLLEGVREDTLSLSVEEVKCHASSIPLEDVDTSAEGVKEHALSLLVEGVKDHVSSDAIKDLVLDNFVQIGENRSSCKLDMNSEIISSKDEGNISVEVVSYEATALRTIKEPAVVTKGSEPNVTEHPTINATGVCLSEHCGTTLLEGKTVHKRDHVMLDNMLHEDRNNSVMDIDQDQNQYKNARMVNEMVEEISGMARENVKESNVMASEKVEKDNVIASEKVEECCWMSYEKVEVCSGTAIEKVEECRNLKDECVTHDNNVKEEGAENIHKLDVIEATNEKSKRKKILSKRPLQPTRRSPRKSADTWKDNESELNMRSTQVMRQLMPVGKSENKVADLNTKEEKASEMENDRKFKAVQKEQHGKSRAVQKENDARSKKESGSILQKSVINNDEKEEDEEEGEIKDSDEEVEKKLSEEIRTKSTTNSIKRDQERYQDNADLRRRNADVRDRKRYAKRKDENTGGRSTDVRGRKHYEVRITEKKRSSKKSERSEESKHTIEKMKCSYRTEESNKGNVIQKNKENEIGKKHEEGEVKSKVEGEQEDGEIGSDKEEGEIEDDNEKGEIEVVKKEGEIEDDKEEGEIEDEEDGKIFEEDVSSNIKDSKHSETREKERSGRSSVRREHKQTSSYERSATTHKELIFKMKNKERKEKDDNSKKEKHRECSKSKERYRKKERHESPLSKSSSRDKRIKETEPRLVEDSEIDVEAIRKYEEKWGRVTTSNDDKSEKMKEKVLAMKRKKLLNKLGAKDDKDELVSHSEGEIISTEEDEIESESTEIDTETNESEIECERVKFASLQDDSGLNIFQRRNRVRKSKQESVKRTNEGNIKIINEEEKKKKRISKKLKLQQEQEAQEEEHRRETEETFIARRMLRRAEQEKELKKIQKERDREYDEKLFKKVSGTIFEPSKPVKGSIFKKRHANQLFIRGDNIVLVAYEKPTEMELIRWEEEMARQSIT